MQAHQESSTGHDVYAAMHCIGTEANECDLWNCKNKWQAMHVYSIAAMPRRVPVQIHSIMWLNVMLAERVTDYVSATGSATTGHAVLTVHY